MRACRTRCAELRETTVALVGRRALLGLCACFLAMRAHVPRTAESVAEDDGFVILHGWILNRSDLPQLDL